MPRGRSTFTKRQKEQTRQQKQRAEAQAALFRVGSEDEPGPVVSIPFSKPDR
jgi:hypothetical protein